MTETSGMRQRREVAGGSASSTEQARPKEGFIEDDGEDDLLSMDSIMKKLHDVKESMTIGLSNRAKEKKDLLEADPYNPRKVYDLGAVYADENQWQPVTSVLSRVWRQVAKRDKSSDLDETERLNYLLLLCEGCLMTKHPKRALEVFKATGEPLDHEDSGARYYWVIATKIYGANGKYTESIRSFNRMLEGCDFNQAAALWFMCRKFLKEVGADVLCEAKVKALVQNEAHQQRLDNCQKFFDLYDETEQRAERGMNSVVGMPLHMVHKISVLFLIAGIVGSYLLQTEDASSLFKLLMWKFGVRI